MQADLLVLQSQDNTVATCADETIKENVLRDLSLILSCQENHYLVFKQVLIFIMQKLVERDLDLRRAL